jgi:hypothetical protein
MLTDTFLDLDTDYFLAKKPLPDNGLAISGSGWCFKKEKQGFLSELMESYYNRRKSVRNEQLKLESELELIKSELETSSSNETLNRKKLLLSKISSLDTEQMAIKTLINSLYGAYGESNFLFFDIRLAEAITMSGKLAILWVSNAISKRLNQILKTETVDYAIYNDTDSSYIALDKIVENSPVNGKSTEEIINFMDAFCKNIIQPTIESCYDELAEYTNAYANKMSMKREALADVGVWCCHPDVTIIVDDAPITIKELYDSSVNGIVDKECLSFNPTNKCFEIDIIEEVLRRPFSGDMYEFYLESGEILRVTGDHIIFIEREGKLLEVRAKDLIETDELISIE